MKTKKSLIIAFIALVALGMSGLGEAQHVRSTTYRPHYSRGHHSYGHTYYRSGYHGGIRFGVGVGWGGYYRHGYGGYVGYRNYPTYYGGYYGPSTYVVRSPAIYVARPPLVVDPVYQPQYPVTVGPMFSEGTVPTKRITLKPGEMKEVGNLVVANIDGKIVILQPSEE